MDLAPSAVAQSASDVWSNRLLKTTPTAEHRRQIHVDGGCRVACISATDANPPDEFVMLSGGLLIINLPVTTT